MTRLLETFVIVAIIAVVFQLCVRPVGREMRQTFQEFTERIETVGR